MRSIGSKHPLLTFFVLAYLFSWVFTLPLLLGTNGLGIFPYTVPKGLAFVLTVLFSFGPLISGLFMAKVTGYGAKKLLKHYLYWRRKGVWYIVALLLPPLSILLGSMLFRGSTIWQSLAPGGISDVLSLSVTYVVNLLVLFFIGGPLGEETGWRGFALPRLQKYHNPLTASLILGVLWALWHLPNFFIPEMGTFQGNLVIYLLLGLSLSIIHSWVYNGTDTSLLLVTLLHAAIDSSTRTLLPVIFGSDRATGNLVPLISFSVWAILIIIFTRARIGKKLVR